MTFIIRTPEDKLRAIDAIRDAPFSPLQHVVIKDYKRNRSLAQNDTFHQWVDLIVPASGYTREEVKDKLVLQLFPAIERVVAVRAKATISAKIARAGLLLFARIRRFFSMETDELSCLSEIERYLEIKASAKDGYENVILTERRSTTTLSIDEMSRLLDATAQVAHTLNVVLPMDDEFRDSMK